jgi:hypothetical protein
MVEIEFSYKQQITVVQCELNNKIKDIYNKCISKVGIDINSIYFIYSGNKIDNNELKIDQLINNNDRSINKMKILVESINESNQKKSLIKSNDIICPNCKEKARINIKDYNINIYGCKNNHNINIILFDEFENLQKIDRSKIICDQCKINNKNDSYLLITLHSLHIIFDISIFSKFSNSSNNILLII